MREAFLQTSVNGFFPYFPLLFKHWGHEKTSPETVWPDPLQGFEMQKLNVSLVFN